MAEIEGSRRFARGVEWFKAQLPGQAGARIMLTRRWLSHTRVDLRIRRGGARCRPSFLIIGAMKAGTTSLFAYLTRHPQVIAPIIKEIRYFDWNWPRPLDWYWAHFPLVAEAQPARITGEASPFYLGHPKTAERVANVLPQVKLIALLRDPIGRAVSHYHHAFRAGWEKRTIEEALLADESFFMPDAGTLEERGPASASRNYIARGHYADQLERWFDRFDRSQILVLQSERFFADPVRVYAEVLDFLDLQSFQLNNVQPYNAGRYRSYLSKDLLQTLANHYVERNRRLYELLGVEFGWERGWQNGGMDYRLAAIHE